MNPEKTIFCCPVCKKQLIKTDTAFQCRNKHVFDIAKEGYVNLLLANQKRSPQPGDNREMIQNRRAFLGSGHFDPLLELLSQILGGEFSKQSTKINILDVGCGEGHYLGNLSAQIKTFQADFFGVDISKIAVRYAAKKYPTLTFAVGTVKSLPILKQSVHCILNIFAPKKKEEFYRVLSGQGALIVVMPSIGHMKNIRAMIYDSVTPHDNSQLESKLQSHFSLAKRHSLTYDIVLQTSAELISLLNMTPFYWRSSRDAQKSISQLANFEETVSFLVEIYYKK